MKSSNWPQGLLKAFEAQGINVQPSDPERSRLLYRVVLLAIEKQYEMENVDTRVTAIIRNLRVALDDVDRGYVNEIFKPKASPDGGHPGLPTEIAMSMAFASAAVSLTPRGSRTAMTRRAARKIGVTENRLKNFRKNLMASKIKTALANGVYSAALRMVNPSSGAPFTPEEILEMAWPVAPELKPKE